MFTFRADDRSLAMVNIQWPGQWHERTFRAAMAAFRELAASSDRQVRFVMFIKDGAATPNATQRQQIAATTQAAQNACIAIVTRSHLHRAILTAVTWLNPALRGRQAVCATFEEACAWMARASGEDSAVFRLLLAEAEREGLRAPRS